MTSEREHLSFSSSTLKIGPRHPSVIREAASLTPPQCHLDLPPRLVGADSPSPRAVECIPYDQTRPPEERPYTSDWDHLADVWPKEVKARDGGPYRAEWKEERPGFGRVRCEMETPSLLQARKAAQRASLLEGCSLAWVTLPVGTVDYDLHRPPGQDHDTFNVWTSPLHNT